MSEYTDKLKHLEQRTVKFSVAIITQLGKYYKNPALRPAIDQVIRSASSIGANYAEANNSSSKADFRSKIYIAKKESGETRYWLKVLTALLPGENLSALSREATELNLILQKITSTLKDKGDR